MKEILLFTGGVDSFIAYFYLNRPPCLYVDLGHRYAEKEKKNVMRIAKKVGMDLRIESCLKLGKWEEEDANIPMRNMFLVMIGSYFADRIYLITQRGEMSIPDRSKEFYKKASEIISFLHGKKKEVYSPFFNMTKQDIVGWYKEQGLDLDLLKETISCFSSAEGRCGRCPACFRQWVAFSYNGIDVDFRNDITKWEGIKTYKKKLLKGEYEERRTKQTLEVLRRYGL